MDVEYEDNKHHRLSDPAQNDRPIRLDLTAESRSYKSASHARRNDVGSRQKRALK
jgi:hypothetical protein